MDGLLERINEIFGVVILLCIDDAVTPVISTILKCASASIRLGECDGYTATCRPVEFTWSQESDWMEVSRLAIINPLILR